MFYVRLALILLVLGSGNFVHGAAQISEGDRKAVLQAVTSMKTAIINKNIQVILGSISKTSGLTCTDTKYSYPRIVQFLKNPNSHLYLSLFESTKFSKLCGSGYPAEFPAISEMEFFFKATNPSIEVNTFGQNSVRVVYKSNIKGHYQREWYFKKENGVWKFVDGFIIGNCFCG